MPIALARSTTVCAFLLLAAPAAAADTTTDRDAARALADAGFDLFSNGRYPDAIAKFQAAEAKFHAPTNLLFLARAEEKLGRLAAAHRDFLRAAEPLSPDAPKAFRDAQVEAEVELEALGRRVPRVRIVLRAPLGKVASVQIDGAAIDPAELAAPIVVDPGSHTIVGLLDGAPAATTHVELPEGAPAREVVLELASTPAPAPDIAPRPVPPPIVTPAPAPGSIAPAAASFSIGGAALVLGGVTGGLSLAKVHDLKAACPTNPCSPSHRDLADGARTLGNVSTAGFVIAGVGVAAGVVLVLVRGRGAATPPPQASLRVGPRSLFVEGSF